MWITARRHDVGVFYFAWERAIPFGLYDSPLSLDRFFFVAAPFSFREKAGLRLFVRRVVAAILVAGLFFLLLPLRLGFRAHLLAVR